MIVNVNPRGHSFKGITAYLLHDKGATTSERVLWTSTHNLHTDDVERASRFMAWTDINRDQLRENSSGAKARAGNVYHFSLSRPPEASRGQDWMSDSAHESVAVLGLEEHQYYIVAHGDTEHEHVHVVVNLAHPETGKIARLRGDFKKLDRWANEFEKQHGIECEDRAKKYEAWDKALEEGRELDAFKKKAQRDEHRQVVSAVFQGSDSARAFVAGLDEAGLALARGNRRGLVIVDQEGEIYALNRLVELDDGTTGRAKTKLINDRLKSLDRAALPMADGLAADRQSFDRDAAEVEQQKALDEAANSDEQKALQAKREAEEARKEAELKKAEEEARRRRESQRIDLEWQAHAAKKFDECRTRWNIDHHTDLRDQAKERLAEVSGFWSRIFRRRTYLECQDQLRNRELQLAERTARLNADLEAIPEQKEAWIAHRQQELQDSENRELHLREPSTLREQFDPGPVPDPAKLTPEERRLADKEEFMDRMRQERERRAHDPSQDRGMGRE